MAERCVRTAPSDRGVEKALVALKKGAHLLKCGRRGKPKFCPFRLSSDEKLLIWYSGEKEKHLKLSAVSKTVFGQKTINFLRQPQPGKESQSFSLIYLNGQQSLDLICKDKEQAETWFLGLTALVSCFHHPRPLMSLRNARDAQSCINSPMGYSRRKNNLGLLQDPPKLSKVRSLYGSPPRSILERYISDRVLDSPDIFHSSRQKSLSDMQLIVEKMVPQSPLLVSTNFKDHRDFSIVRKQRMSSSRIQVIDSESNAAEDTDVLKDVFMWGEGVGGILGGGLNGFETNDSNCDSVLPKLMESTRMLDVMNISCGQKHAALVTRQGEVFCWGEENGGRLGHKINMGVPSPKVVESLSNVNVNSIACGARHTCALTNSGEVYVWGDIGHGIGLSGEGCSRSRWLPQRMAGLLDGIHVSKVSCGEWHTAIVSSSGQLFTYGDGTFGVLGHGNLQSFLEPKEVESLKGLRVKAVACGPWHTAAIVEVMASHYKSNALGGKLFTWGDGDKGKLGHGDMERKLLPTCVASLVDCDFLQVSCGRTLTVALTVTGIVFTMGSAMNGQLGNPQVEDRSIATVGGLLKAEFVKEISAGSFHVAALTTKGKVYTWGKGANGRLGLGDVNDRNSPALVEALEDRYVRSIACGSSFTAAICSHKSMSSKDQSICSGCKMDFGFTRKKHNCYNCGFAFCHACSSKKAMNASLAPNKSKSCRVCDPCFVQLTKVPYLKSRTELASPRLPFLSRKGLSESKVIRQETLFSGPNRSKTKSNEEEAMRTQGSNKHDQGPVALFISSTERWGQVPCPPQFNEHNGIIPFSDKEISDISHVHAWGSPLSVESFPPNATSLKQDLNVLDKMLTEEIKRLNAEATVLEQQCQYRSQKLQHYKRRIEETWLLSKDEAAKCKAAKDVIKVLTHQMNVLSEKASTAQPTNNIRSEPDENIHPTELSETGNSKTILVGSHLSHDARIMEGRQMEGSVRPSSNGLTGAGSVVKSQHETRSTDGTLVTKADRRTNEINGSKEEWVEQDEIGVYITFIALPSGQRGLKRVRFSRKHFSEKQAERWWKENETRIYTKYNVEQILTSGRNRTVR